MLLTEILTLGTTSALSKDVFFYCCAEVSGLTRKGADVDADLYIPTKQKPLLSLLKAELNWLNRCEQVWPGGAAAESEQKPAPTLALGE